MAKVSPRGALWTPLGALFEKSFAPWGALGRHWSHNGVKKGLGFRGQNAPKITTIPKILQMEPWASEMSPRAFLITQNHDSDLPKI